MTMENTNSEVVELQVKPNDLRLELTNNIGDGLYDALENPYYKAYLVSPKGDGREVELKSNRYYLSQSDEEKKLGLHAKLVWDPSTQFSEKRVNVDGHTEKREVAGSSKLYGRDFQVLYPTDMEGVIVLSNGKFLMNRYGKYQPNLSFLNSAPEVRFEKVDRRTLNFDEGDFSVIYGEFFISKKGTKCFRVLPKEKAKHILICDSWGGAFDKYRGRTLPEDKAVYYRRASSNGGGCGCDYGVYDVNFKNEVSEDDI